MLGLALLCQDQGEAEAAQDYLDASHRKLEGSDDKRAELFSLQTTAVILIDNG